MKITLKEAVSTDDGGNIPPGDYSLIRIGTSQGSLYFFKELEGPCLDQLNLASLMGNGSLVIVAS